MRFCTAINCMDGRVQLPVISFLKERYGVAYVDMITEPGPNRVLAEETPPELVDSIRKRIAISVEKHGSGVIAVVGHEDCAGNTAPRAEQEKHIGRALAWVGRQYPNVQRIGLWVALPDRVEVVGG